MLSPAEAAAAGVTQGALPEREPHPGVFLAFEALMAAFEMPAVWPAIFVRFEAGLLEDLKITATSADQVGLAYDTALALVKQRYRQQHAALTAQPAPVTQHGALSDH